MKTFALYLVCTFIDKTMYPLLCNLIKCFASKILLSLFTSYRHDSASHLFGLDWTTLLLQIKIIYSVCSIELNNRCLEFQTNLGRKELCVYQFPENAKISSM